MEAVGGKEARVKTSYKGAPTVILQRSAYEGTGSVVTCSVATGSVASRGALAMGSIATGVIGVYTALGAASTYVCVSHALS